MMKIDEIFFSVSPVSFRSGPCNWVSLGAGGDGRKVRIITEPVNDGTGRLQLQRKLNARRTG